MEKELFIKEMRPGVYLLDEAHAPHAPQAHILSTILHS